MDDHHEGRVPGSHAGDQVGLGRVVEDRREAVGSPDRDDPGGNDPLVQEASEESFPASDPPTFMSDAATPRDRGGFELPTPDEVP